MTKKMTKKSENLALNGKRSYKMTHQQNVETTKEIEEDTKIHSQVTPVTVVTNVSPYNIC